MIDSRLNEERNLAAAVDEFSQMREKERGMPLRIFSAGGDNRVGDDPDDVDLNGANIKLKVIKVNKEPCFYMGAERTLGEDWLCWLAPGESEQIIEEIFLPLEEALSVAERADPKFWELMMIFWIYSMSEPRKLWEFFETKKQIMELQVYLHELGRQISFMEFDDILDRILKKPRQLFVQQTMLRGIIDTLAQFPPTESRQLMLHDVVLQTAINKLRMVLELDNHIR